MVAYYFVHRRQIWVNLILGLVLCAISIAPALAQESTPEPQETPPISFAPFVLEASGHHGIVPAEWSELEPGTAIREDDDAINSTYIVHIVYPDTPLEEIIAPLLTPLQAEALPDESETIDGQVFEWARYEIAYEPEQLAGESLRVSLAVAEDDDATVIVVLQSNPEEHEALIEQILLPTLDVFGLDEAALKDYLGIPEFEMVELAPFGIRAKIPVGWINANPGAYMRRATAEDFTTLLIQTSPDLDEVTFAELLLQSLDISEPLPDAELIELDNALWSLYEIEFEFEEQGIGVTLALATATLEEKTVLIALLSDTEDAEQLREHVVLKIMPDIDSLEPSSD